MMGCEPPASAAPRPPWRLASPIVQPLPAGHKSNAPYMAEGTFAFPEHQRSKDITSCASVNLVNLVCEPVYVALCPATLLGTAGCLDYQHLIQGKKACATMMLHWGFA